MWFILNILRFGRRHTKKKDEKKKDCIPYPMDGDTKKKTLYLYYVCVYVSFNIYIFCHEYFNVVWISLSFLCVYVWHLMPFAHLFHRQHLTVVVAKCIKKIYGKHETKRVKIITGIFTISMTINKESHNRK